MKEHAETPTSLPGDELGILDLIDGAFEGDTHWTRKILRTSADAAQFLFFLCFWIPMSIHLMEPPDWAFLGNFNPTHNQKVYAAFVVVFSFLSVSILSRIIYLRRRDRAMCELVEVINRQLVRLSRELAIGKKPVAAALYRSLVYAYQNSQGEKTVEYLAQACGTPIRTVKTAEIGRHFRAGAETATEYLCVINASPTNQLLKDLPTLFDYFSKFDRERYPRDRITRVFSLRAERVASEDDSKPATLIPEWTPEKRELLFAALWINKCCGVDTKLHLYMSSDWNDFFEDADYVLCYDPAADPAREKRLVFHALPEQEQDCLRVEELPWLYDLFHFEFYKRLTGGHGVMRDSDQIIDFTRMKWGRIRRVLGLKEAIDDTIRQKLAQVVGSHPEWSEKTNAWFSNAPPA